MLRCGRCGRHLDGTAAWKGGGERFYCNEFCAEVEQIEAPPLVPRMSVPTLMRFSRKPVPGGETLGSSTQVWARPQRSGVERASSRGR
jgi:hypothetical protein